MEERRESYCPVCLTVRGVMIGITTGTAANRAYECPKCYKHWNIDDAKRQRRRAARHS